MSYLQTGPWPGSSGSSKDTVSQPQQKQQNAQNSKSQPKDNQKQDKKDQKAQKQPEIQSEKPPTKLQTEGLIFDDGSYSLLSSFSFFLSISLKSS